MGRRPAIDLDDRHIQWACSDALPTKADREFAGFAPITPQDKPLTTDVRVLRGTLVRAYPDLKVHAEQAGLLHGVFAALLVIGEDGRYYYAWKRRCRRRRDATRSNFFMLAPLPQIAEEQARLWLDTLLLGGNYELLVQRAARSRLERERRKRDFFQDVRRSSGPPSD